MKILFKRNSATTSTIPASLTAGEPLWFKDILYIGSTGQHGIANGPAIGDLQRIVDGNSANGGTLELSTSAQTYLKSGPYEWKIKLPDSDPYNSPRTPTSHEHGYINNDGYITDSNAYVNISTFGGAVDLTAANPDYGPVGILVNIPKEDSIASESAIRVLEMIPGSSSKYLSARGTFEDIPTGFSTFTPANSDGTGKLTRNSSAVSAGAPAGSVTIAGGNKWIDLAGDNTAGSKTIVIGHAGPGTNGAMITAGSSADQNNVSLSNGDSFTVPRVSWDAAGHITSVADHTLSLPNIRSTDLYCASASDVRNKNATAAVWPGIEGWYRLVLVNENKAFSTDTTAVTLSVNGGTSYPIRLNGTFISTSSTVNRDFPAGVYDIYFTGDEWRIISRFYGNASNAIVCNSGGGIVSKYAGSASPFTPHIGNYPMFFANTNDVADTTLRINGTLYANNKLHVLSSNGWKDVTKTYSWPSGWSYPYFDGTDWWFTDTGKMIAGGYAVPLGTKNQFLTADGNYRELYFNTTPSSTNKIITQDDLGDLTGAMVYRDSVTRTTGNAPAWSFGSGTTPDSANQGDVYVVGPGFELTSATAFIVSGKTIPAGKYEAGDMIIYNGSSWNVINGENQVEVTAGGAELIVPATNTLGSAVTIAKVDGTDVQVKLKHDTTGVVASSYGESAEDNTAPGYGGSLHIPYITVNTAGHVTSASTKTITLPASQNLFATIKSGSYQSATGIPTGTTTGDITAGSATDNITIGGFNRWIITKADTGSPKQLLIAHAGPGDNGTMITAKPLIQTSGSTGENSDRAQTPAHNSSFKIPYFTYDAAGHITSSGTKDVTLPAGPNNGNLKIQADYRGTASSTTADTAQSIITMDSSSDATIKIAGARGLKTYRASSSGTVTIGHDATITERTTAALVKIKYDAYGHITDTAAVQAADIPGINDSSLILKAAETSSATTTTDNTIFTANASSDSTVNLSNDGTTGKFRFASNTIYLDVIDGGLV